MSTDPPSSSQKDHMVSTGCMDDDGYNPEQYVDVVMSVIKPEDLVALYNTVCRSLEISPGQSRILAEGILARKERYRGNCGTGI